MTQATYEYQIESIESDEIVISNIGTEVAGSTAYAQFNIDADLLCFVNDNPQTALQMLQELYVTWSAAQLV